MTTLVSLSAAAPDTAPADTTDPDADIVAAVRNGDRRRAVELLIQRYGAAVHRYCLRMLSDYSAADDVRQAVFVDAYQSIACFGGRSRLRAWLWAIAHNRAVDEVRRARRAEARAVPAAGASCEVADPSPSALESLDDLRLHSLLAERVEALPLTTRTALLLRYQAGLTFVEIGQLLGECPGTVHARIARTVARLRRELAATHRVPQGHTAPRRAG